MTCGAIVHQHLNGHGSVEAISPTNVYGNQGNGSANNVPGARYFSSSWTDLQGNFWLFGGLGYGNSVAQLGKGQKV